MMGWKCKTKINLSLATNYGFAVEKIGLFFTINDT